MIIDLTEIKKRPWYPSYPEGIRKQLESYSLPEIPSYRFLESSAKYFPNSTALVYEPENFLVNYLELCSLCERFASGLQNKLGVKKGDRVAIYARNYPEFVIALFGISMAGAVYVACNPLLTEEEVAYQIKDSGAGIAVTSDDLMPVLKGLVEKRGTPLERVIVFTRNQELKPALLGRKEMAFKSPLVGFSEVFSDKSFTKPVIHPKQDLTAIMYTSGTTGYPKGVMISHYNVVSSTIMYQTAYTGKFPEVDASGFLKCANDPKDLTREWDYPIRYGMDSVLVVPPWTHMLAYLGQLHFPVMAAMAIFPMPAFNKDSMLDMVRRWKISFAGGAPQMMAMLLSLSEGDQGALYPIRAWTTGGSPVPTVLAEKFSRIISGVITEGYSLTEATISSTKHYCNRSGRRKYGSIGSPLPFIDMKVVDILTGKEEMPVGQEGELIQNGPTVTLGYLNRPEATQETFRNGWLYTGDLAVMDAEGLFYITGRKKELIIYKGYNIAPRMLEEILYKHPDVLECAVVGKKDDMAGEIPVAFVTLKEGRRAAAEEIMAFVNEKVAPYKKIRELRFIDKIPVNPNGKVMRKELVKMV
ncbi:MAG: acyl--CoA ligase [Deltaproteobacteria bacterium]|nr:acyl--CoA ligase [Deltaproteobacteria bacterium]